MDDEYFWAEIAAKVASDAAPRAADRPCATVDFLPLLPKNQGEMDTVADLAVVETAVSPTAIFQNHSSGIGAKPFSRNMSSSSCATSFVDTFVDHC